MVVVQERLLYPIPEAASLVAISRATFYKEIARGAIRTVRIGGAVRVPADELRRYVESLKAAAGG
jgi:excisionase family DNA binding protein